MKKLTALLLVLTASLAAFTACSKVSKGSDITTTEASTAANDTTQPDPLDPANNTTQTATEIITETTTETETSTGQVDPLGGGAFKYNSDGAVEFAVDIASVSDEVLISAAQALFKSACVTEWNFECGSRYDVDMDSYIENSYGWRFCRIKNEGINSLEDVRRDYCKVFSDKYIREDVIRDYFKEQNGSAYVLCASRGGDIHYTVSKITAIESRSDSEIFFTVENYYDGTDFDGVAPYSNKEQFSAVIEGNVLKAGKFSLPY